MLKINLKFRRRVNGPLISAGRGVGVEDSGWWVRSEEELFINPTLVIIQLRFFYWDYIVVFLPVWRPSITGWIENVYSRAIEATQHQIARDN